MMMYQMSMLLLTKFLCVLLLVSYNVSPLAASSYNDSKPLVDQLKFTEVTFTVTYNTNTDANSYGTLISSLRTAVTGTSTPTLYNAFRLLPVLSTVNAASRFVLIRLTNINQVTITLAVDVVDLYVIGYQTGTASFFFKDYNSNQAPYNNLFTNTNPRYTLPFGGGYTSLIDAIKRAGGQKDVDRDNINLGLDEINYGIQDLSNTATTGSQDYRARPLLVLIQMVSEAARFGYIEREVQNLIRNYNSAPPSASTIELENNWGTLSEAIQTAVDGRFVTPVKLFGQTFYSINAEIKATITVLKNMGSTTGLNQFVLSASENVAEALDELM